MTQKNTISDSIKRDTFILKLKDMEDFCKVGTLSMGVVLCKPDTVDWLGELWCFGDSDQSVADVEERFEGLGSLGSAFNMTPLETLLY